MENLFAFITNYNDAHHFLLLNQIEFYKNDEYLIIYYILKYVRVHVIEKFQFFSNVLKK